MQTELLDTRKWSTTLELTIATTDYIDTRTDSRGPVILLLRRDQLNAANIVIYQRFSKVNFSAQDTTS